MRRAFTVVEMLVVLAILAILMALTVLNVSYVQKEQLATQVKTESSLIKVAAEAALYDGVEDIDMASLVREGYLSEAIESPQEGYRYVIIIENERTVRVEWKKEAAP